MTSSEIQLALMRWAQGTPSDIVVPNYYVGRWEMDVCKVTKAGQMTEYEIKTSKADYKKDWEKSCMVPTGEKVQRTTAHGYVYHDHVLAPQSKHSQIQAGKRCNRFYFVCREGLIMSSEVPKGYGLIWVSDKAWDSVKIVKRSSLWTKESVSAQMFIDLAINIGIKYTNLRNKIKRLQSKPITTL